MAELLEVLCKTTNKHSLPADLAKMGTPSLSQVRDSGNPVVSGHLAGSESVWDMSNTQQCAPLLVLSYKFAGIVHRYDVLLVCGGELGRRAGTSGQSFIFIAPL
jgi:hypothetical protein